MSFHVAKARFSGSHIFREGKLLVAHNILPINVHNHERILILKWIFMQDELPKVVSRLVLVCIHLDKGVYKQLVGVSWGNPVCKRVLNSLHKDPARLRLGKAEIRVKIWMLL